jgi:hypothetical protein
MTKALIRDSNPFCPKSQSGRSSCCLTMVVAQHSAESLAPFDWDPRLIHAARRYHQPIAQPLMVTFTMIQLDNGTPMLPRVGRFYIDGTLGTGARYLSSVRRRSTSGRYSAAR